MIILEQLIEAKRVVEEAKLPPEYRVAAFEHALKQSLAPGGVVGDSVSAIQLGPDSEPLERIASALGLDIAIVGNVFDVNGSDLNLVFPSSRLDSGKAGGTRQVALLVAAARQALGWDEGNWSSVDLLKPAVTIFGKFDPANFATSIYGMQDVFVFRGTGIDREVRVTKPGMERAAELVREFAAVA